MIIAFLKLFRILAAIFNAPLLIRNYGRKAVYDSGLGEARG